MKKKIIATFLVLGLLGFPILALAVEVPPTTKLLITTLKDECGMRFNDPEPLGNGVRISCKGHHLVGVIDLDSRLRPTSCALGFIPGKTNMITFHYAQAVMYLALQTEMGKQLPKTKSDYKNYAKKMERIENTVSFNLDKGSYTKFEFDDLIVTGNWNDELKAVVISFTRNY